MSGHASAAPLTLPRASRLQRTWEFEKVRREGRRLVKGCLVLNWRPAAERAFCRVGVITSRRIGNAVERTRARRLMREVFRLHQREIKGPADLILLARPSIKGKGYRQVEKDFLLLLKEANLQGVV
jgi:ribonuclease P protein component